jgi:selenocysteine lyase/cysteine desulfurase
VEAASDFDVGALRAAYGRFLGASGGRILLTGHSHQAWPDVVEGALARVFDDAARLVDDKWSEAVFPKIEAVGAAILERMGFPPSDPIAFGKSTHELAYRLITSLPPPQARPRVVSTEGEFHSLYRQLRRLAEEGMDVVWVPAQPREGLADRLLEALVPGTAMLALSAVLFEDAHIVPRLGEILERATSIGAIALVDAYHAFNVVPLEWGPAKDRLFVTAGGYKYAAFGEGICWLRVPRGCELRPVYTGWFADFGALARERGGEVTYGPGGARFTGATFDPTAFYRAEAVLEHWDRFGLTPERLRVISLRQTERIIQRFDAAGLGDRVITPRESERRGGFVAVRAEEAASIVGRLRERGVLVDSRGSLLRLGPAPYLTDAEIDRGSDAAIEEIQRVR